MAKIPDDIQDSGSSTSSSGTDDSTDQPDGTAETTQRPPIDELQDSGGGRGTGVSNTSTGGSVPDEVVNSGPTVSDPGDSGNAGGSGQTGGGEPEQPSQPATGDQGTGQQPVPVDELQDPGGGVGPGGGNTGSVSTGDGSSGGPVPDDPVNSGPGGSEPDGTGNPESSGQTGGGEAEQPSQPSRGDQGTGQQRPRADELQQAAPGAGASDDAPTAEEIQEQQNEREYFEENYTRGPSGAGERLSGESGLADEGSPGDPLEGQGVERGFGSVADTARDFEYRVVSERDDLDAGDTEVNYEDGQLVIERAVDPVDRERENTSGNDGELLRGSTSDTDTQLDAEINEARRIFGAKQSNIQRGPGTDAQNERDAVRQQVRDALEAQGVDPGDFDIQVARDGDELEASAERQEQFGDFKVFVGDEQAEELLSDLGEGYTETVGGYVDTAVESEANPFTGALQAEIGEQFLRSQGKDQLADRVQRGQDLQGRFTKGFNKGAAELVNVPSIAVGAKEAAEFVGYSGGEIASGEGGELASDVVDRGAFVAEQAAENAAENPVKTAGSVAGGLASGFAAGSAASALGRSGRLSGASNRLSDLKTSAKTTVRSRTEVSDFVDDTRGQADFGTQTKQKTLQRGEDTETDSATTLEEMEEQGIVEVKNRDTSSELSDVEAEARERLPDADEYPSQSQFERELTQQMRRIEQRQRSDTDQDLDTETETVAVSQQQTQATAAGLAGTTAVEATKFAADDRATADTVATTMAGQQEATAAETVAETGTIAVTDVGTQTTIGDTTAITTGDTTAVTDTTTITDTVQTTDQTTGQVTVDTTMLDGDGSGKRRRDFDLSLDGEMDDVLLGGEPGGEEEQFEYEARDLL